MEVSRFESTLFPMVLPVDDASRAGEVRRAALACGRQQNLQEEALGRAGIVATELATNLVKHAQRGEIQIAPAPSGIELLSIDRGPGIRDVERALEDGVSSAGTPGTGLGAIRRLSNEFDLYSQEGRGTVVVSRIFGHDTAPLVELGAVVVPYPGEIVCGDHWCTRGDGRMVSLIVADGLGHGLLAADSSRQAVRIFEASTGAPAEVLERVHRGLRGTRGAAVAIAAIDFESHRVSYAGIGNIAGVLVGASGQQQMVSHNGTAGHEARRIQQFEYVFPPGGLLVMHSDGLSMGWNVAAYPGLRQRHAGVISGALYRDSSRGRDDSCIVVLRSLK